MLTPQEVSSHVFSKAMMGGYNMAMVDEFLDVLTEDYTALYNDNAILKNKLKVLSDTVEEYRATDDAMRKTLLSAQQMADSIIQDAELKKANMIKDAESSAHKRLEELKVQIAAEEAHLKAVQDSMAEYVSKVDTLFQAQELTLRELTKLGPAPGKPPEVKLEETAQDIENNLAQVLEQEAKEAAQAKKVTEQPRSEEAPATRREPAPAGGRGPTPVPAVEATRRFDDLQFGRDYEIR